MEHTYAFNSLTNFKFEADTKTGNGNQVNLLKICLWNFVKSHQVNLFLAVFSHLKPLCSVAFFSFFISFLRFATNCSRCDGISRTTQNGCWHQCIRDICSYRWPHWDNTNILKIRIEKCRLAGIFWCEFSKCWYWHCLNK